METVQNNPPSSIKKKYICVEKEGKTRENKVENRTKSTKPNTKPNNRTKDVKPFSQKIHKVFRKLFTVFSTELSINLRFNFFNLITKRKISFQISGNPLNAIHNRSVVFYANFRSDFWRAH